MKQEMKTWNYLLITLVSICSFSCVKYKLTETSFETKMFHKGRLLLTKYKKGEKPDMIRSNESIRDTVINVMIKSGKSEINFYTKEEGVRYAIWYPEGQDKIYDTLPFRFRSDSWYSLSCLHPRRNEPQCYTVFFKLMDEGDFEIEEKYFDGGPY